MLTAAAATTLMTVPAFSTPPRKAPARIPTEVSTPSNAFMAKYRRAISPTLAIWW